MDRPVAWLSFINLATLKSKNKLDFKVAKLTPNSNDLTTSVLT